MIATKIEKYTLTDKHMLIQVKERYAVVQLTKSLRYRSYLEDQVIEKGAAERYSREIVPARFCPHIGGFPSPRANAGAWK